MADIYNDYHEEPKDVFYPLPENLGCELYDLEMDPYVEDIVFYDNILPPAGTILELGCGSGRISSRIGSTKRHVVGIDLSLPMLHRAYCRKNPFCSYICMDMNRLSFTSGFNGILIPYNTLNLLPDRKHTLACLHECKRLLCSKGVLLLQLHIPSAEFCAKRTKSFQFQMFDRPGGGKVIKEILKIYHPASNRIEVEERYRIRPMCNTLPNEDWNRVFTISGYSANTWFSIFKECGLTPLATYGTFDKTPFTGNSPSLIVVLT